MKMNIDTSNIVKIALLEDLDEAGDVTAYSTIPEDHKSRARVIAKQAGVISGIDYFKEVFHQVDPSTKLTILKADGEKVVPLDKVVEIEGFTGSMLSSERTALNFLGHLSGIATMTNMLVARMDNPKVKLLDTRKTLPGLRLAEKKAVLSGGGFNHRIGLFDMILIKENHVKASGGIESALMKAKDYVSNADRNLQIEIEVRNLEELGEAMKYNPDRIMLDNFTVENVRKAVQFVDGRIALEVSGGVNYDNIREYAEAGPDFISVGSITSSAPALDLSMLMEGIE